VESMVKIKLSTEIGKGGIYDPDESSKAVRNRVDGWLSRFNPQLQGEIDAKNPNLERDSRGLTLYEQRIEKSFKKEMALVVYEFSEQDAKLRSNYEINKTAWATEKDIYQEPASQEIPQVSSDQSYSGFRISNQILKIAYVVAFLVFAGLDYFFLTKFIEISVLRVLTSSVLSAGMLISAYYIGKLYREQNVRLWLVVCMIITSITIFGVFILMLNHIDFDITATIIALLNLGVIILMVIATFLSRNIKPVLTLQPRKVIKNTKKYSRDITRLAMERKNIKERYKNLQEVFIQGANELIKAYRWSLKMNIPEGDVNEPDNINMPDFRAVELFMQGEIEMDNYLQNMMVKS
jgi:hypothetical protein